MIDSVLLIDTFFVLFRSSRGRYIRLIVPEDLFNLLGKRVFQTSFLCQIVVQSLGKISGNANVPLPCTLVSTYKYHTVGQGSSFDGSLAQDDTRGFEFAGNAFQVKEKDKWTMEGKPRQKQFKVRRHVHQKSGPS